jgi:hypothetical protein
MTKIQREKKILVLALVVARNSHHINFLKSLFHSHAENKRKYVFSYVDVTEDDNLVKFFGINKELFENPKIVVYNFNQGKYFISEELMCENISEIEKNLNDILNNLDWNQIKWTSGYLIEEILHKFGINVDRNILLVIFLLGFMLVLICVIIGLCYCLEKVSNSSKKIKQK